MIATAAPINLVLEAIDASFPGGRTGRDRRQFVGRVPLKLAYILLARHQGEPMPLRRLADLMGGSVNIASDVTAVLRRLGYIEAYRETKYEYGQVGAKPMRYRILNAKARLGRQLEASVEALEANA